MVTSSACDSMRRSSSPASCHPPTFKPGTLSPGLVFRQSRRTLQIAIEVVVVDRRHARVIQMAGAMPDAVLLFHAHVAHLDRQEVFDHRLPNAALEDIRGDLKGF